MFFKQSVQFHSKILDLRKNKNDHEKKEEIVFPTNVNKNKHFSNEVNEKTIKLRYNFKNIICFIFDFLIYKNTSYVSNLILHILMYIFFYVMPVLILY